MQQDKVLRKAKYRDLGIAAAVTVILVIAVGIFYDYYYEFNDDVLMKNILSGAYTGTPENHNIQMLWPISALLSVIYRIFPEASVYGFFLCLCQYGCFMILTYRVLRVSPDRRSRIVSAIVSVLFAVSVVLAHFVMVQYTITVAIIAATAVFIFYTIPDGLTTRAFLVQSIPAVLLVILAFLVRSEMLLLMCPYIAIAGFVRWNRENKNGFQGKVLARYGIVIGTMIVGMGLCFVIDKAAYSSDEWKTFLNEFNGRTQLYDYQYVPDYEENKEFYDSIGLSQADVDLLTNYDYGIDDKINGDIITKVADYASDLRDETLGYRLKTAAREYLYRLTHPVDGAYQALTLFLYIMMVWAILARTESTFRHKAVIIILRLGGLFVMRSISWMYIILGHREPDRIVHSLYIIEIILLLAMLTTEFNSKLRERGYIRMISTVVLIGGGVILIPLTVGKLNDHIEQQQRINSYAEAIDVYCSARPDNFYFEDVYSTIRDGETFNEKMFEDVDNTIMNYDLIGGWVCNSPLYRDKLAAYGITDVDEDILTKDNVYIICDNEYDMDWAVNYYAEKGIETEAVRVGSITTTYGVYKMQEID